MRSYLGERLAIGGFYHVPGDIAKAFDFDIQRVIKTHLRIATPLEFRDNVKFGQVCNFRPKLIEEVQLNDVHRKKRRC